MEQKGMLWTKLLLLLFHNMIYDCLTYKIAYAFIMPLYGTWLKKKPV